MKKVKIKKFYDEKYYKWLRERIKEDEKEDISKMKVYDPKEPW